MLGEFFAIITMLAAVGVGVWVLDWVQRGWSEIVEPVQPWGDVPFLSEEARGGVNFAGEGTVKAAPAQVRTNDAIARLHGKGL